MGDTTGALSGSAADLVLAFAGTVTEHTGTVTITDAPNVAQLKAINAATTGAITLDVTNGALSGSAADLVLAFAGTVTEHTGTVAVTDPLDLAQLKAINNAFRLLTLNDLTVALNGSSTDVAAALARTIAVGYSGNVTLSDAPSVAQLKTINNGTSEASLLMSPMVH